MYLKLMSHEDAPDGDSRKGFRLIECEAAKFERDTDERPVVYITYPGGEIVCEAVVGNAYLLNEQGKTIASFGVSPLPKSGNVE